MSQRKQITFMGLGIMGMPMVKHLIERNTFDVTVWNRSTEKALPLKEKGAYIAGSSKEAIERGTYIITMLWDFQSIVDSLSLSSSPSLSGKTIIQMSTIGPDENLKLQEMVIKAGGVYIESPVLGTVNVAESKNLQCMVGSTPEKFEEIKDILESFGPVVRYIGEVGKASALKLTFNHIVAAQVATFATSLAMVIKQDLPVETFMEILRNSAVYCKYFDMKLPSMQNRDFSNPYFYSTGAYKDVSLIVKECKKLGMDTTGVEGLLGLMEKASKKYPNCDFSCIYNIINPQ